MIRRTQVAKYAICTVTAMGSHFDPVKDLGYLDFTHKT